MASRRNTTRATLVEGERSHHCAISAAESVFKKHTFVKHNQAISTHTDVLILKEREKEKSWFLLNDMEIYSPLWQEETILNQDSHEKEQKSLNYHHKDITASNVPAERISHQVLAWKKTNTHADNYNENCGHHLTSLLCSRQEEKQKVRNGLTT